MRRLHFLCMAALALFLSASSVEVRAADACRRYRAELADLRHSVHSVAGEIADLTRYKQDMGCLNATGFFDTRPPACAAVDARIQTILQSPDSVGYDNRDKQQRLRVLIHKTCDEAPRPREANAADGGDDGKNVPKASGGSKLICVRTCDGAYAPIERSATGYAGADELCKASCPGTAAAAYSMPPGDDGLNDAASVRNKSAYTALPNAFLFRTSRPAACTCAVENVPWSTSLQKAEDLLPKHKNDVIVTAAVSAQLSTPNANAAKILANAATDKHAADGKKAVETAAADGDAPRARQHVRRERFHSSLRYATIRAPRYAQRPRTQSVGADSPGSASTSNPGMGIFGLFQ